MPHRLNTCLVLAAFFLSGVGLNTVHGEDSRQEPAAERKIVSPEQLRTAIGRGLTFLQKDVVTWREEHQCATCHHGTMTLWVLSEARRHGYEVSDKTMSELLGWSKARFWKPFDPKKDLRPGYNVMPLALSTILMAAEAGLPGITPGEISQTEVHFTQRQDKDGGWLAPPPANGPVPVFESREVLTLRACLALMQLVRADLEKPSDARSSLDKAAVWLKKVEPGDTTQAAVFRLLLDARVNTAGDSLQPAIDRLLKRQNPDGGWSQIPDLPGDAYATGQALYALSEAKVKPDRLEVRRGGRFLLDAQREDGSWPMTPRTTPARKASKNIVPITYFGSAWATLGLIRSETK